MKTTPRRTECPSVIAIIENYKRNTDYGEDKHPHTLNMDDTKAELKCAQINLQYARVATANLMKYIAGNKVHIISIEESYIHQGRAAGIDTKYKIYTAG